MTTSSNTHQQRHTLWSTRLSQWKQSNLSGAQFCKDHALNYDQFNYWRRKIDRQTGSGTLNLASSSPSAKFVPVQRQSNPAASLSLTLANGWVLQGINRHTLDDVRALLEVL